MMDLNQSSLDRAVLSSLLSGLYELLKTTENYLKQADSVENSPEQVEKASKIDQIEGAFDKSDFIAKIVVNYRDRLVRHGMEPNLAGSLAKELSGRLWSELLEGGQ